MTTAGRLLPHEGAGLVIALYLELAQQVDFWVGTVGPHDVYAAFDRATVDDAGMADGWRQRADGTIEQYGQDWNLTPLAEDDGPMVPLSAARAFHEAPDLFAAVWTARLERLDLICSCDGDATEAQRWITGAQGEGARPDSIDWAREGDTRHFYDD